MMFYKHVDKLRYYSCCDIVYLYDANNIFPFECNFIDRIFSERSFIEYFKCATNNSILGGTTKIERFEKFIEELKQKADATQRETIEKFDVAGFIKLFEYKEDECVKKNHELVDLAQAEFDKVSAEFNEKKRVLDEAITRLNASIIKKVKTEN